MLTNFLSRRHRNRTDYVLIFNARTIMILFKCWLTFMGFLINVIISTSQLNEFDINFSFNFKAGWYFHYFACILFVLSRISSLKLHPYFQSNIGLNRLIFHHIYAILTTVWVNRKASHSQSLDWYPNQATTCIEVKGTVVSAKWSNSYWSTTGTPH